MRPGSTDRRRTRIGWLEALLILTVSSLLLQLFPVVWDGLWLVLDVRGWPRSAWMAANAAILALLVGARLLPALRGRERRTEPPSTKNEADRIKEVRERREAIHRAKEARRRRLY